MRLVIDSLVAVMLAGVLASIIVFNRKHDEQQLALEQTRQAIRQIEQQISLQITLERVEVNDNGFPRTVDPTWFQIEVPDNAMFDDARPWLEVAGPEDRDLEHPARLTAVDPSQATFWYNPYRGIVRARVPEGISDAATIRMYNAANGTSISSIAPILGR